MTTALPGACSGGGGNSEDIWSIKTSTRIPGGSAECVENIEQTHFILQMPSELPPPPEHAPGKAVVIDPCLPFGRAVQQTAQGTPEEQT